MKEELNILISRERIAARVAELAAQIDERYRKVDDLLVVGTLNGSYIFMADLTRALTIPIYIDFTGVTSYGDSTTAGELRIIKEVAVSLENRHVLLIEDIVDTGVTLARLTENFKSRNPASLAVCTLLDKPSRRVVETSIDFIGFTVEDKFVVGYGMDYAQKHRALPHVAVVNFVG